MNDIREKGYEVYLQALEIGSRGYISSDNEETLKSIHSMLHIQAPFKKFKMDIAKLSIISSFVIFQDRTNMGSPPYSSH